MTKSRELGVRGEQIAASHLERSGYRIVERNWRCRDGELDIIAETDDVVAVVEVKTRTGLGAGHPFESVTPSKVQRLRRLAVLWAREQPTEGRQLRIDVVGVTIGPSGDETIEHLEGIGA